MKIKDAEFKTCSECGCRKEMISDEIYGCDQCQKQISMEVNNKTHHDYLQLTVFRRDGVDATHHQFCSWACVVAFLAKVKSDYFATLPHLQFEDDVPPGQRASDLLNLLGVAHE